MVFLAGVGVACVEVKTEVIFWHPEVVAKVLDDEGCLGEVSGFEHFGGGAIAVGQVYDFLAANKELDGRGTEFLTGDCE